ncbi:hypothetical protein [uncultured Thiodictyon sp.]|nr:hypothetical protein [uncultured Thiodictyon sp.]
MLELPARALIGLGQRAAGLAQLHAAARLPGDARSVQRLARTLLEAGD